MTIRQAIDALDASRCNSVDTPTKVRRLSTLDGIIHREVILTHEHEASQAVFSGYDAQTDPDTPLLIAAPYDAELYPTYLQMQLDRENGEFTKYNQSATLFNQALLAFQDWYNRTHKPLHSGTRFVF